jgi:hypothetical protein
LLLALEAEALFLVHLPGHAGHVAHAGPAALAAEEGLHLGHHVCVWLLLLLLRLLLPLVGRCLGGLEGCLAGAREVEGVEVHLFWVGDIVDFFNAWVSHCGWWVVGVAGWWWVRLGFNQSCRASGQDMLILGCMFLRMSSLEAKDRRCKK